MLRESSPVNLSPLAAMRQSTPKGASLRPIRFLTPLMRPYWKALGLGFMAILAVGASTLAIGQVFRHLVDNGLTAGDPAALHGTLIKLAFLVVVLAGGSYARLVLLTGTAERIIADLRVRLLNHLLGLDLGWFQEQKTGDLVSRLTGDIAVLQILIGTSLPIALRNILLVAGGMAMMAFSSLMMSLLVLAIIPALLAVLFFVGPKLRRLGRSVQEQSGILAAQLAESLGAIRDLQAFTRENLWREKFAQTNDNAVSVTRAYVRQRALLSSLMIALVFVAIGGLIGYGGTQVIAGTLSAGELSAFVFYALLVAGSVGALSEIYGDMQRASGALERIHDVLSVTPLIQNAPDPQKITAPQGVLKFENVTFAYPSRSTQASLSNLSLTVTPGKTLAIVGPSGAGKTTLFHLLLRFYDPQSGRITLDDMDIRSLDLTSYRGLFAFVPQDPTLFSSDVAANISFGDDSLKMHAIQKAAGQAGAEKFIQTLPEKYKTILGERGAKLSGGQAQRLALARALLRETKILLLDEATAHLDSETESAIQDALRSNRADQTTLIIAHRLSTVQHADQIIVLDNGKIAASGTHSELLGHSELYQRLTKTQLQAA